jgi:hypothetical protein
MDESKFAHRFYQYTPRVGKEVVDHTKDGRTNSELNLGVRTVQ